MCTRAASFGDVAQTYDAHRPGYPGEAVRWLVGTTPGRVLELGAGTGKLTAQIAAIGHEVIATDPSPQMLLQLREHVPAARVAVGRAETIPLSTGSVDIVVAAQAFHWFDEQQALGEITRALRPGGVLSLVWNAADLKVPWVRKVSAMAGITNEGVEDDPVAQSELFTASEGKTFRHWQQFHRASLIGYVASSSHVSTMPAAERDRVLADVGALYDSYGRGPDGMLMPWTSYCYRSRVTGLAASQSRPRGDADDGLLIDFP